GGSRIAPKTAASAGRAGAGADEKTSGADQPAIERREPAVASAPATPPGPATPAAASPSPAAVGGDGRVKASPIAKRIARDRGLDLHGLAGSGPGGRIVKADVEKALASGVAAPAA